MFFKTFSFTDDREKFENGWKVDQKRLEKKNIFQRFFPIQKRVKHSKFVVVKNDTRHPDITPKAIDETFKTFFR